ncbi:hypothetical protein GJ496_011141 [Pomphorhynchus laevis]|nr:hypothetical protein GJ496_011141 [Pomphorhynchus laevis]
MNVGNQNVTTGNEGDHTEHPNEHVQLGDESLVRQLWQQNMDLQRQLLELMRRIGNSTKFQFKQFDMSIDNWCDYLGQLRHMLLANGISCEQRTHDDNFDRNTTSIATIEVDYTEPRTVNSNKGAAVSIISVELWHKIGCPKLTNVKYIHTYAGGSVQTMGSCDVCTNSGCILIFDSRSVSVFSLTEDIIMDERLNHWLVGASDLFADAIGSIRNYKASLCISNSAEPKCIPARRIPLALQQTVKNELYRLIQNEIIEIVDTRKEYVEWSMRWCILLSQYQYTLEHADGRCNAIADMLSRCTNNDELCVQEIQESGVNLIQSESTQMSGLSVDILRNATQDDMVIKRICKIVETYWPNRIDTNYKPYYDKSDEISLEYGILMRAGRIFIPSKLRRDVLKAIHAGHAGIVGMKSLSRTYVWWPGINGYIEQYPIPNSPWHRVHADFAGPVDGEMNLIMVCAMTKWPEVLKVISTNAQCDPSNTNTPHASTGKSSAFMLYGRRLCTMFDRIRPTPALTARKAIEKYKFFKDTVTKCCSFQPGQAIWYRRPNGVSRQRAKVTERSGWVSYKVANDYTSSIHYKTIDPIRVHADQLRNRICQERELSEADGIENGQTQCARNDAGNSCHSTSNVGPILVNPITGGYITTNLVSTVIRATRRRLRMKGTWQMRASARLHDHNKKM